MAGRICCSVLPLNLHAVVVAHPLARTSLPHRQQPERGGHCQLSTGPKHSVQACSEACVQEHGLHHGGCAVVLVSAGWQPPPPSRHAPGTPVHARTTHHVMLVATPLPCVLWSSNQWVTTKTLLESIRGMGDPVHVVVIDDASSVGLPAKHTEHGSMDAGTMHGLTPCSRHPYHTPSNTPPHVHPAGSNPREGGSNGFHSAGGGPQCWSDRWHEQGTLLRTMRRMSCALAAGACRGWG